MPISMISWHSHLTTKMCLAGITRLACLKTQPVVITACLDGAVRCWDVRTGMPHHLQTRTCAAAPYLKALLLFILISAFGRICACVPSGCTCFTQIACAHVASSN